MVEREIYTESECKTDPLTSVELLWPNVEIRNKKELITKTVNACIVLCPLYEQGDLDKAGIIKPPTKINESRVFGKIKSYLGVIKSLSESLKINNKSLSVNFVVANKGVILPTIPNIEDDIALEYHNELYKNLIDKTCKENQINYSFSDYNSHKVDFPTFVNLSNPIPENPMLLGVHNKTYEYSMIDCLNNYLKLPEEIENNKSNRHVVKGVLHINGMTPEGAFWIIAGYLAFDHKINTLIGENGLYFVSERIDQLFGIAKLTPSLSKLTRIQIKS